MTRTAPSPRSDEAALRIRRGVTRLLLSLAYMPIYELTLPNGRRADVAAIGKAGDFVFVEIKSGLPDFRADSKWEDYLEFTDRFYFAVAADFPRAVLPDDVGVMVADSYGGAIIREAPRSSLPTARRKAMTQRFARLAAERLARAALSEG